MTEQQYVHVPPRKRHLGRWLAAAVVGVVVWVVFVRDEAATPRGGRVPRQRGPRTTRKAGRSSSSR